MVMIRGAGGNENRLEGATEVRRIRRRLLGLAMTTIAVALAVTGCTASGPEPKPTSTPTTSATRSAAVAARLQDEVWGRLPAGSRTAPALTWEDTRASSSGDSIDLSGDRRLLLAAACEGEGAVKVTVTGRRDMVLSCRAGSSVGPIDLTPEGDPPGSVEFDVKVGSGDPQYFAAAVASAPKKSARS